MSHIGFHLAFTWQVGDVMTMACGACESIFVEEKWMGSAGWRAWTRPPQKREPRGCCTGLDSQKQCSRNVQEISPEGGGCGLHWPGRSLSIPPSSSWTVHSWSKLLLKCSSILGMDIDREWMLPGLTEIYVLQSQPIIWIWKHACGWRRPCSSSKGSCSSSATLRTS